MSYAVKEIFYSLQGEGANAGRPAVFCRFSGCNLWSGREGDRAAAKCPFCDTDFVGVDGPGGGRYVSTVDLAGAIASMWPLKQRWVKPFVVCTGGEPLLQLDVALVDALHDADFEIAIETNGTRLPPDRVDWICVSPKGNAQLELRHGNELKLVFPQENAPPEKFESLDFTHFFLQPMDGPNLAENTRMALEYCLEHPWWRLSLQTHKMLSIR
jgi:7-carboxy-7-deazaguanine synthase